MAVLFVLGFHAHLPFASEGGLGVDIFFVLSGFLITNLLMLEYERSRTVRLGRFYARRFLRLFPALALLIAAVSLVTALHPNFPRANFTSLPYVILYVGNWVWALTGDPNRLGHYSHTWSLAVEEQFYLLWPAALIIGLRRGRGRGALLHMALLLAGLSLLVRAWVVFNDPHSSRILGTDAVAYTLMLGCSLALGLGDERIAKRVGEVARAAAWPCAALMLVMVIGGGRFSSTTLAYRFDQTIGHFLFAVAACVVIARVYLEPRSIMALAVSMGPLVWVGRISYGLYLWHYPIFVWVQGTISFPTLTRQILFETPIALGAAILSYAALERPILKLKARL